MSSEAKDAIALYSTSVEDLLTVACFLAFHEISELPRNTQYPVMDLLLILQVAQSASLKDLSVNGIEEA